MSSLSALLDVDLRDNTSTAVAVDHCSPTINAQHQDARALEGDMPAVAAPIDLFAGQEVPFLLRAEDVACLAQSDGFTIMREHLAHHYHYELCKHHRTTNPELIALHTLTRDILHALLVPVVELFDKATSVAEIATHASRIEDLEYAYTAEARGAFLWLQCFLDKERDWTFTRGCPACVAEHALDSEFTIRLLYAACLLSDIHYPFTLEGPTLPSFMFFAEYLQDALEADELWGEGYFEHMTPKAVQTRHGIEDLIHQCLELDALLASAPATPSTEDPSSVCSSASVSPVLAPIGGTPGMKVKRSRMAKRQMRLKVEEEQWMEEMLKQTWQQLQPNVENGLLPVPTASHSLDAVVKAGTNTTTTVSVAEVPAE